jgi:hypothetical protein
MILKRILEKKIELQLAPGKAWTKDPFTPEMIQNFKDFKPGDIIHDFGYRSKSEVPFMSMDSEEVKFYWPYVTVIRKVEETDEEYMARIAADERVKEATEKKDWLEYLRLKAKYENK